MSTRLKVVFNFKQPSERNGTILQFTPVTMGSSENEAFFKFTPGGQISFYCANPVVADEFEMGKQYYVDITPAE